MKVSRKGQVTIPQAMRDKHGLRPKSQIEFVDQPNGILLVKAGKRKQGQRILATMLRGGKVNARTDEWLRLTRG